MTLANREAKLPEFNGGEENFTEWRIKSALVLESLGLWDVVGNDIKKNGKLELAEVRQKDTRARNLIVQSVSGLAFRVVAFEKTAFASWQKLLQQYESRDQANLFVLQQDLMASRMPEGGDVMDHLTTMRAKADHIRALGGMIDDINVCVLIINSLPHSWKDFKTAARVAGGSINDLSRQLMAEKASRKLQDPEPTEMLAVAKEEPSIERLCRLMESHLSKRRPGPRRNRPNVECFKCHEIGHFARDCRLHNEQVTRLYLISPKVRKFATTKSIWIVDSGATSHMSPHLDIMDQLQPCSRLVSLGDGHVIRVKQKGVIKIRVIINGQISDILLQNVLHVPGIAANFLSLSAVGMSGKFGGEWRGDWITIEDKASGKLILTARSQDGLYKVETVENVEAVEVSAMAASSPTQTIKEAHLRLGHASEGKLHELARTGYLPHEISNQNLEPCFGCMMGRQTRHTIPNETMSSAKEPLDLVVTDVCGKMPVPAWGSAWYFGTIIDVYSRKAWVFPISEKGQMCQVFRLWLAEQQCQRNRTPKTVRSDNGGEYCSDEFKALLKEKGIKHELTVPRTPQQNGLAERFNRSIMEKVRSMMHGQRLPLTLWAHALAYATHVYNNLPSRGIENQIPEELWTGLKTDHSRFHEFGAKAFVQIPAERRGKLSPNSRKCIFIGIACNTKDGYLFLDPDTLNVFVSRDVIFSQPTAAENGTEIGINETTHEQTAYHTPQTLTSNIEGTEIIESTEREDQAEQSTPNGDQADSSSEEPAVPNDTNTENEEQINLPPEGVRRSTRGNRAHYNYKTLATSGLYAMKTKDVPDNYEAAIHGLDKPQWTNAMQSEYESLLANDTWELIPKPENKNITTCKWVYRIKDDPNSDTQKYKARLVARGFSQKLGEDYTQTFAPVISFDSLRIVLGIAAARGWPIHQMDVANAYLNSPLTEDVFMKQPIGFEVKHPDGRELVCKLKRALYGLKQGGRAWYKRLTEGLKEAGFVQLKAEQSIYIGHKCIVAAYVDDLVIAGESLPDVKSGKDAICSKFLKVRDLGPIANILGMEVTYKPAKKALWMNQDRYTQSILELFKMNDCNARSEPMQHTPTTTTEPKRFSRPDLYMSAVGKLLYLARGTRPDISFAVGVAGRHMIAPTEDNWNQVKAILRYISGTTRHGIKLGVNSKNPTLVFSDADWAGDTDTRRSTGGYWFNCFGPISWRSTRQQTVSLSSYEAEYIALSDAARQSLWLIQLLSELGITTSPMTMLVDNNAAICAANGTINTKRRKHVDIRYHFVNDLVEAGVLRVERCASQDNVADGFTKPLGKSLFQKFRENCGVCLLEEA